uniref:C6H2-type domain-containing protein n=1 Tax=Timema shepardi TaxID=629360 RepID=A0A7R9B8S3_TIMSH|nr:unnamed protein product [Timema shepardi]
MKFFVTKPFRKNYTQSAQPGLNPDIPVCGSLVPPLPTILWLLSSVNYLPIVDWETLNTQTNFHQPRLPDKRMSRTASETIITDRVCETPGCNSLAKLQCPTCIKLGIQGSYFCSQDCFKGNWKSHKVLHKIASKLRAYPQAPRRTVSPNISRPDYADHSLGVPLSEQAVRGSAQIRTLSAKEIEGMRVACKVRDIFILSFSCLRFNTYRYTGLQLSMFLDHMASLVLTDSSQLTSDSQHLVDVTVYHRGYHGDLNETFLVGDVSPEAKKLVRVTSECLSKSIDIDLVMTFVCLTFILPVKPGEKYREIGNVIQKHAQSHGFSVVRSYCGHGIHQLFHTAPSIPHYAKNKAVGVMKAGHCFTIEPMISQGSWRDEMWPDKWTAVTVDGMLSAQFEHTLLVTDVGCEILTRRRTRNGQPYFMDNL